ncbi:RNA polymerase sigma factor [Sphingobium amiense]|uniref:RNA polymerase sigma factor n=1 Tax=Sphingobium amiense TaxID=135719 RepID=A0A494W5Y6_9SPHN|nr:RNA polymerase sigma factor [Sphingobium amiense]BBD99984.1 RNA polymerase sigma factor [Sphingobium amiense]
MKAEDDGSPGAGLAAMLEAHRSELMRFLAGRCGSVDEAQDVLQDLWIKASSQPAGPIGNPRAYLFRMANNLVLDRLRGARRAMRRDRDWIADGEGERDTAPEARVDPSEPADERIARQQEAEILRSAIARLPDGAARALRLYRFENLSQGEIAQRLGISRSGVEKHLALAMKHLRAALIDCGTLATAASLEQGAEDGAVPQGTWGQ